MPDLSHYNGILTHQFAMNRETWSALQRHDITEQSQVRLDFTYLAPDRAKAVALEALLREQTDYEVSVQSQGPLFRRTWTVTGSTRATSISPEILDQWVRWMVTAGKERECDFDGWGTAV